MRAWNRAKLLWGYVTRRARLDALPVEYIVETTAKCNLYCPMCPRETHPQPKADMTDEIFRTLLAEAGDTAEHMMLIGLGEPFMDPKIFERIEYCHQHSVSTLLSTNGTFLDERYAGKVLDSPLEQITLSFDGFKKETFEFYRKGAKFEKVRDNFVRFARMKHERGSKLQIVVQMVRMEGNAVGGGRLSGLLEGHPRRGCIARQRGRNQPDAARCGARRRRLEAPVPLPLARSGVRETERRRLPLLPELHAGRQAARHRRAAAAGRDLERTGDAADAPPSCHGARRRGGHLRALLHHHPASRPGGRQSVAARQDRSPSAARGGAHDVSGEAAHAPAAPPKRTS